MSLTFPRASIPERAPAPEPDPPTPASTAAGPEVEILEEARQVLLIEDNFSNLELIRCVIERERGIRLLVAMQRRVGLERATQNRPELILLDLPDFPGDGVLRRLRANPATETIPVVMVTADATPAQSEATISAGAADYLMKPLDVRRLMRVIRAHLPAIPSAPDVEGTG